MATPHICHVDCKLEIDPHGRRAHIMFAAEPSSAAGRYQWEQNAEIKRQGRRAWRATGQGQSRECRVWDRNRLHWTEDGDPMHGIRRAHRALLSTAWN